MPESSAILCRFRALRPPGSARASAASAVTVGLLGLATCLGLAACAGPGQASRMPPAPSPVPSPAVVSPSGPVPRGLAVQVVFDHPERFRDVRDAMIATDRGRDRILADLQAYLETRARSALAGKYGVMITVTDIRLAGDFEPWHGPDWDDIRVIRDIYPPYFTFSYAITGADGAVVRRGRQHLLDLNFQSRPLLDLHDPLRYEKDLLNDWVRSTLDPLGRG